MSCLLSIFIPLIIYGMPQYLDAAQSLPNSLAALQSLLLLAWLAQGICFPYLGSRAISTIQDNGLLEWWIAAGIFPWRVALGQSLAILTSWSLYLLLIISPLSIWLGKGERTIPYGLLIEHNILYLISGEVLLLLTFVLGTFSTQMISCLGGVAIWSLSLCGGDLVSGVISHLPGYFRIIIGWGWYSLPRFDFFYRPLSLVYLWPPLDLPVMASILGYGMSYGVLLLLCCEILYHPRYSTSSS